MNPKIKNNPSIKLALQLSLLLVYALLPTGCADFSSVLMGPQQPPPPATWNSAPGFSAASIDKIAIITEKGSQSRVSGGGDRNPALTGLEDVFIAAAFKKGYRVSDRSDVDRVLQEIRFQQSGLTEADAAKLGRMLNVPAVLIVRITGSGVDSQPTGLIINGRNQYRCTAWCKMSARLISVEKAEVLGLASYSAAMATDSINNDRPAIDFAAGNLAAALPSRNSP